MKAFSAFPAIRLRLLVLSIALIIVTTMIPIGLRHPSASHIDYIFNSSDFINNIILYLPLGIALGSTSARRAVLVGFSLATCAELLQLGYIDRVPSPFDIASNTCGALVGYFLAPLLPLPSVRRLKLLSLPRALAIAALPLAVLGTIVLVRHRPNSDFSNWNPTFDLEIGDEVNGGRPWIGSVSRIALYPSALAPSVIQRLAQATAAAHIVNAESPLLDLSSLGDSALTHGHPLLSKQQELRVYQSLVKANKLTLLVWMRTSSLKQKGPARIVTYSQDSFNRNFTLGQVGRTLTFRLRTPASGFNGTDPALTSGPLLSLDRTTFLAAVYDGRTSELYVDGKFAASADLGARRPRLSGRMMSWLPASVPIREIELSMSEICLGGLFALGLFAIVGTPQQLPPRALIGALGGLAIGAAIWLFAVSDPKLGLRILVECAAAGLVVSAAIEPTPTDVDIAATDGDPRAPRTTPLS